MKGQRSRQLNSTPLSEDVLRVGRSTLTATSAIGRFDPLVGSVGVGQTCSSDLGGTSSPANLGCASSLVCVGACCGIKVTLVGSVEAGRTCSADLRGVSSPADLRGTSSSVCAGACCGIEVMLAYPASAYSSSCASVPHGMLGSDLSSSSSSSSSPSLSSKPCRRFPCCSFAHSFFAFLRSFPFAASAVVRFTTLLATSSGHGRSDSWAKRSGYKSRRLESKNRGGSTQERNSTKAYQFDETHIWPHRGMPRDWVH